MALVLIIAIIFVLFVIWKYWTLLIGAGYDPTPMDRVKKMLELAEVTSSDVVYDLGCGDGRILVAAAKDFGAKAVGIEIDPLRFVIAWIRVLCAGQRGKVEIRFGDLFKMSINDATVITIFLYQPANNRLKEKLMKELKPGTRIVSYTWTFDNWRFKNYLPDDRIYLYVT